MRPNAIKAWNLSKPLTVINDFKPRLRHRAIEILCQHAAFAILRRIQSNQSFQFIKLLFA